MCILEQRIDIGKQSVGIAVGIVDGSGRRVIDRKTPVMQSFSLAREITKGNELTTFLMGLLAMGIVLIGVLALCVGFVFAQPLAAMLFACGYLVMSGQYPRFAAFRRVHVFSASPQSSERLFED